MFNIRDINPLLKLDMSNSTKFKDQSVAVITKLTKMHIACFNQGLTQINSTGMELVCDEVEETSHTKLINNFIKHHDLWNKVLDKDSDFLYIEVPKIYQSDQFDSNVLVISLKCFDQQKKSKTSPSTWAVSEDDQKAVWIHFKNMVTLACRHIKENPSKYPKVQIDELITKYKINL